MIKKPYFLLVLIILILFGYIFINKNNQSRREPGMTLIKGKLVESFPQLPVYPGSSVEKSYKKVAGARVGYEAEYLTDKSPKEAMLWYKDELTKQGWTIISEEIEDEEGEFSLMLEKNGEKVKVFAENEDGKTEISIEFPLQ